MEKIRGGHSDSEERRCIGRDRKRETRFGGVTNTVGDDVEEEDGSG